VSGTDFYNLFSGLAIGADGYCDGGQINVDGTLYSITRLAKGANSLTFYTSGGTITVNKFTEGTSVGVYTELAITEAINFQAVAGGIEVKHIFPWGTQAGTPGTYDIGTLTERFSTAYLQYLDVLNNVLIRGAMSVTGDSNVGGNQTVDGTFSAGGSISTRLFPVIGRSHSSYSSTVTNANLTYQIPSMEINEERVLNMYLSIVQSNSTTHTLTLKAPATAGTYYVNGVAYSAGATIYTASAYHYMVGDADKYLSPEYSEVLIIWRKL
jgi:hypothetical protein